MNFFILGLFSGNISINITKKKTVIPLEQLVRKAKLIEYIFLFNYIR